MSKFHSYLNSASSIIREYNGEIPLSGFLKNYFKEHKKFGSQDRKEVSSLTFQYYRLGYIADDLPVEEKILAADFICREQTSKVILNLKPEWLIIDQPNNQMARIEITGLKWAENIHTPWLKLLSPEINPNPYVLSFLSQPDLFIRIRPGKKQKVLSSLEAVQHPCEELEPDCLRLANNVKLDEFLTINRDVVVQDVNSSKCGQVIKEHLPEIRGLVWDTCAASGGKSILMHDLFGKNIKLMVSDIRPTIMQNLKNRFAEAGVSPFHLFLADLTQPINSKGIPWADVALIDAPCTGSGTWARTPEQHHFFNPSKVEEYAERQIRICANVLTRLKPGGHIIYITCSVFKAENEQVLENLVTRQNLSLVHWQYLPGTALNADSMFIAILQKD